MPRPAADADVAMALATAGDRERLIIRLCAELGLRIGEAVKVRLHRDADGAWLYVVGKGLRTRRIPLGDDLARVIESHDPGHLFPGSFGTGHLSPNYASRIVSRHLPPGVTPHKLRHRFATRTYAASHDVLAVQQLLGHSSPVTTQAYVATQSDNLRHVAMAARL